METRAGKNSWISPDDEPSDRESSINQARINFSYRIWKDGRHKMFYYPYVDFYHKVGSLTKSFDKGIKNTYRGDFFIKQNTRNHIYFLKQISGVFAYVLIIWLFFKNNIRFVTNPEIRKNLPTWWLINKSYFEGLRM